MTKNLEDLAKDPLKEVPFLYQEWRKMIFLHWSFEPQQIQKTLPADLVVDTFEEKAYLGIIAFRIENNRFLGSLTLPFLNDFVEVNLRTYVRDKRGLKGVWFYSLDIDSFLMTSGARALFALPYFTTPLIMNDKDSCQQLEVNQKSSKRKIELRYQVGQHTIVKREPEYFLIERYLLFATKGKTLTLGPVRHRPYPLNSGRLLDCETNLFQLNGFESPNRPPEYVHFSTGVDANLYRVAEAQNYFHRLENS